MCGLWVSLNIDSSEVGRSLSAMDAVAHRGPDGKRLLSVQTSCGELNLGHRRLSIYDITQEAAQPMQRGDLSVVFNGSIYNFKDLRTELQTFGVSFTTTSDTEVLLAAWTHWGYDLFRRLDGMFALIIFDAARQQLIAARDRFGEKPLHLWRSASGSGFAFSSELQQFAHAGIIEKCLNWDVAKVFLDLGIAERGPHTFIKGIDRVLPGTCITIDLTGSRPEWSSRRVCDRYSPNKEAAFKDPAVAAEALRDALRSSVSLRLVADVPVGSCLSGGLDSSSIARLAAQILPMEQSFECVFASFDEKDWNGRQVGEQMFAEAAASLPNMNLHHVRPSDTEIASCIDDLCLHQGEPFASTSVIAQRLVFAHARSLGLKVMLDGQGADELLVGYSGMVTFGLADTLASRGFKALQEESEALEISNEGLDVHLLKRSAIGALLPEPLRRGIARMRGNWPPKEQLTYGAMPSSPKAVPSLSRLDSQIVHLLSDLSLPSLLRYEDRNSMSFGVESRLPFLGLEVTRVISAIPSSTMYANGRSKAPLREAMRGIVPDVIIDRRDKMGFQTPSQRWMTGPLRQWMQQGVEHACKSLPNHVNTQKARALARDITNNATSVFRLASLGNWMLINKIEL